MRLISKYKECIHGTLHWQNKIKISLTYYYFSFLELRSLTYYYLGYKKKMTLRRLKRATATYWTRLLVVACSHVLTSRYPMRTWNGIHINTNWCNTAWTVRTKETTKFTSIAYWQINFYLGRRGLVSSFTNSPCFPWIVWNIKLVIPPWYPSDPLNPITYSSWLSLTCD